MKTYLAVFLGKPEAMDAWKKLPEANASSESRPASGMAQMGLRPQRRDRRNGFAPRQTKRTDKDGVSDTRNEFGAWTVVKANSQEEAAKLFLNHPHFTIFPGDRVEVMECLPIPGSQ